MDKVIYPAGAGWNMATTPDVTVATFPDTDALVAAAGDRLAAAISEAIDHRGRAAIVLTGAEPAPPCSSDWEPIRWTGPACICSGATTASAP